MMTIDDVVANMKYIDLENLNGKENAAIDKIVMQVAEAFFKVVPGSFFIPIDRLLVLFRLPIVHTLETLQDRGRGDLVASIINEFTPGDDDT